MNENKGEMTNQTVTIDSRRLLRFTRRSAVGSVRITAKAALHLGRTLRLKKAPGKVAQTAAMKPTRKDVAFKALPEKNRGLLQAATGGHSKLRFEGDRGGGRAKPKRQKLMFTAAERAAGGGIILISEQRNGLRLKI